MESRLIVIESRAAGAVHAPEEDEKPPRVLELLLHRTQDLALPHIADAWTDNLIRSHQTTRNK
ncbi:hypothetical protein [Bradyrhizobium tropiciagri]|uniref:hypothetical protein n=1 Tax=Bradyrhizobium tropiciagri TaxID=312253 RepID=UPI00067D464B|nr:hypothetical protein [Bradyrhizobium tropiciagri]